MNTDLGTISHERSTYASEVKVMTDWGQKTLLQKNKMQFELVDRIKSLESDLAKYKDQGEKLYEKVVKLDASYRMVCKEKDRLKLKVIRLSN